MSCTDGNCVYRTERGGLPRNYSTSLERELESERAGSDDE